MVSRHNLRLHVPQVDAEIHVVEQLADLASRSRSAPYARRAATLTAGFLTAVTLTVGGAWASGSIQVPMLPQSPIISAASTKAPTKSVTKEKVIAQAPERSPASSTSQAPAKPKTKKPVKSVAKKQAKPRQSSETSLHPRDEMWAKPSLPRFPRAFTPQPTARANNNGKNSQTSPGLTKAPTGKASTPPGLAKKNPAQTKTPPGKVKTPPGLAKKKLNQDPAAKSKVAPGQAKKQQAKKPAKGVAHGR